MTWALATTGALQNDMNTNVTPLNVPYPTGIVAGDILFLGVGIASTGATITPGDSDFAAGGALIESENGVYTANLYWKVASGAESGTFTLGTNSNQECFAQCVRFTGGPTGANSGNVHNTSASQFANASALHWSALGVTLPNCLIVNLGISEALTGAFTGDYTAPAPFTANIGAGHTTGAGGIAFVWSYQIQTTAANIAAGFWTPVGVSSLDYSSVLAALKPGTGGGGSTLHTRRSTGRGL